MACPYTKMPVWDASNSGQQILNMSFQAEWVIYWVRHLFLTSFCLKCSPGNPSQSDCTVLGGQLFPVILTTSTPGYNWARQDSCPAWESFFFTENGHSLPFHIFAVEYQETGAAQIKKLQPPGDRLDNYIIVIFINALTDYIKFGTIM